VQRGQAPFDGGLGVSPRIRNIPGRAGGKNSVYVAPTTPTPPITHNTPHPKSCRIHPPGRYQTQRGAGVSPDRARRASHAAGFSLRYRS